ncbi:MAG: alanine racemase [Clostridia bacterium]
MTLEEARARCWAEVDVGQVRANYRRAKEWARGARVIPVLKADAYGLGARALGRALYEEGARLMAVATVSEALDLKEALARDADVLVMGAAGADAARAMRAGVILCGSSAQAVAELDQVAGKLGVRCRVHLKVDTGLHRLGFSWQDAEGLRAAQACAHLAVEGVFTHLALHTREMDEAQFARFDEATREIHGPMRHVLDSIGLTEYPLRAYDAVRVGAFLYGVHPRALTQAEDPLAVRLFARVAQVRWLDAGELVGYDDDHPVARRTKVATLTCGYVDGLPRQAGGSVLIHERPAKVLGRACMDQMMVDVTEVPGVRENDVATLLGGAIGLDQYAQVAGLNRNEALSRLGKRVLRVYIDGARTYWDEGSCDRA